MNLEISEEDSHDGYFIHGAIFHATAVWKKNVLLPLFLIPNVRGKKILDKTFALLILNLVQAKYCKGDEESFSENLSPR